MDRSEVKSTLQNGGFSLHSYDALKKIDHHVIVFFEQLQLLSWLNTHTFFLKYTL